MPQKIHGCHPPVTAMVWFNAWPTLRSYRSHRVYTGYIVRYEEIAPPKKNGWIQNPYWEKEEYYPHICDPKTIFFFNTPVYWDSSWRHLKKEGKFQASLDSSYLLFGAPLKDWFCFVAAHKVNCCDLFRPTYVHWYCQILPSTQKKSWGNTKKTVSKSYLHHMSWYFKE